jgi:WXG100 family type VII secretion target
MTADIIQADYEALDQIANRFLRQAELTQQMQNRLQNQIDHLTDTGWEGQAATAFRQEMEGELLPAWQRLHHALEASHQTTLQITHVLRTAEEEAAALFGANIDGSGSTDGMTFIDVMPHYYVDPEGIGQGQIDDSNNSPIWGWIKEKAEAAGNWIVDNRDTIALGGALIGAGIVTIATGGVAAPIIAGVVIAGGITLAINGASSRYPLFDGVLSNMFKGGMIGFGVGTIGTGIAGLGKMSGASMLSKISIGLESTAKISKGIKHITNYRGLDLLLPQKYEAGVYQKGQTIGKFGSMIERFYTRKKPMNRFLRFG